MTFTVGETVVYPNHGAAVIEDIEMRTIKGEERQYLVLRIVAQQDLVVRVPACNLDLVGVRDVVDKDGLDRVFGVLRAERDHAKNIQGFINAVEAVNACPPGRKEADCVESLAVWLDPVKVARNLRTSMIVDPADGQIPFTADGRTRWLSSAAGTSSDMATAASQAAAEARRACPVLPGSIAAAHRPARRTGDTLRAARGGGPPLMSRSSYLFAGIFGAFAFSCFALVLVPQMQIGGLSEHENPEEGTRYPVLNTRQGREVYIREGCYFCHTQQIRDSAGDVPRWGPRRTVAQDYLFDWPVQLGFVRLGPDLMNVGLRQPSAQWHLLHLYNPRLLVEGSTMPPYRFLFEKRRIKPTGPSRDALPIKIEGYEIVPTHRATALVAYLQSLNATIPLFEAPLPPGMTPKPADTNAPAATRPARSTSPTFCTATCDRTASSVSIAASAT